MKIVIYCVQLCEMLFKNPLLVFTTPLNEHTGEIHFPKFATYKNLSFTIYASNRIEIVGSLHKYMKGENFSDFTLSEIVACLKQLEREFQIPIDRARIENIEFGLNIHPQFTPYDFCEHLISYRGEPFERMATSARKIKIGFACGLNQYRVKVYDKGKQYLKPQNILRYELKVSRMTYLSEVGVRYLSDLTNKGVLKALGRVLLENYTHIVLSDEIALNSKLSVNEKKIYAMCSNPKEWEKWNRKKRYKKKIQFENILKKYGRRQWKELVKQMINDKWNLLMNL